MADNVIEGPFRALVNPIKEAEKMRELALRNLKTVTDLEFDSALSVIENVAKKGLFRCEHIVGSMHIAKLLAEKLKAEGFRSSALERERSTWATGRKSEYVVEISW